MNRRAVLAAVSSVALAGCTTGFGSTRRVEVVQKFVRVTDHREDGRYVFDVADRQYWNAIDGPWYSGEVHGLLESEVGDGKPLVVTDATARALERRFAEVRYGVRTCTAVRTDGSRRCRAAWIARDDFNGIEVGDVVILQFDDERARVTSVVQRRRYRD